MIRCASEMKPRDSGSNGRDYGLLLADLGWFSCEQMK